MPAAARHRERGEEQRQRQCEGVQRLRQVTDPVRDMDAGAVWIAAGLPAPETGAQVVVRDFRGEVGARNAALYSVLSWAQASGTLPPEALLDQIRGSSLASRIPAKVLAPFA